MIASTMRFRRKNQDRRRRGVPACGAKARTEQSKRMRRHSVSPASFYALVFFTKTLTATSSGMEVKEYREKIPHNAGTHKNYFLYGETVSIPQGVSTLEKTLSQVDYLMYSSLLFIKPSPKRKTTPTYSNSYFIFGGFAFDFKFRSFSEKL
jgi:hypothetical protein